MPRLVPINPNEIALTTATGGTADFRAITAGSTQKLEIWERILPFIPGVTEPDFKRFGSPFSSTTTFNQPLLTGQIYQVRLYRENQGNRKGNGNILGKLDFPGVLRLSRVNFLTRCASAPQVDINMGGTFVSTAFAANIPTRARVQIGIRPPSLDARGLPFFAEGDVVASAVTTRPGLLNKVSLIDELLDSETTGHTPLATNQTLFFVIFAWDAMGSWDLIWNTTGIAPATPPESIKTLQRVVDVRLHRLSCLDDSDDLSYGEASFKFIVKHDTDSVVKSLSWSPMSTGSQKLIPLGTASVRVAPPDAAGSVTVRIEGEEDDSGSFPPDKDDRAATHGLSGGDALSFPVGEVKEEVDNRLVTYYSQPRTFSELLSFAAEVIYSVKYVV
jgi:hypothetical protein